MKKRNLFLLLIPLFYFTSCAGTFAQIGYVVGKLLEWSLILWGIGLGIFLIIALIGWIIDQFR